MSLEQTILVVVSSHGDRFETHSKDVRLPVRTRKAAARKIGLIGARFAV
jgi:hypothetical protein